MLSTGPGALILAHCVARALPSRPILVYATKGFTGQGRRVRLPDEFTRFVRKGSKVLIVEDLITTGETIRLLIRMVEQAGGTVVGIGCLWQRATKVDLGKDVFSLVRRDFPTYEPGELPALRAEPAAERRVRARRAPDRGAARAAAPAAPLDLAPSRSPAARPSTRGPPPGARVRSATGSDEPAAADRRHQRRLHRRLERRPAAARAAA